MVFCYYTNSGLVALFKDFLNFPVITGVTLEQNSSIEFPSVTICNENRVHCGNLHNYIKICNDVSYLKFLLYAGR